MIENEINLTDEQFLQLVIKVANELALKSQGTSQVEIVKNLDGIYHLPATRIINDDETIVSAPIALLHGKELAIRVTDTAIQSQLGQDSWKDIIPLSRLEGKTAFEIWVEIPGNVGKTTTDYFNYLREPAIDAAKTALDAAARADAKMVQISADVNQLKQDFIDDGNLLKQEFATAGNDLLDRIETDASKVNTDLTTAVEALEKRAETVISETNTVKEAAETAVINADSATKAATDAAGLANTAAKDTNKATELAVIAVRLASEKAELASTSADKADKAAGAANDAATLANEKATLANNAAGVADTATGKANTAITNAETATKRANDAATAAEGIVSGIRPNWTAGKESPNYIKNKPEIPTLQGAPKTDTISYVNTDGTLTTYRIGDEVRVLEDGEYVFYRLYDLSEDVASWQEAGSGTALPGNIYLQGATYYNESVRIIKKGYLND